MVIGSETSGGIENVFIRDCLFTGSDRGLRFKSARRRGAYVRNIWAQDIEMRGIRKDAIIVNMLRYTKRFPAPPNADRSPLYDGFHFKNITCDGAACGIRMRGIPERPMRNLTFENITMTAKVGLEAIDADGITLRNVNLTPTKEDRVMRFIDTRDVTIEGSKCPEGIDTFVRLEGERTGDIRLVGNDTSNANETVSAVNGATGDAASVE